MMGAMTGPSWTIRLFTSAFVLAVGYERDDATSDEDQWPGFRHIDPQDYG